MHINRITIRSILMSDGFAPWFSYARFNATVRLADAIADTCNSELARLKFMAMAASDIYDERDILYTDVVPDAISNALEKIDSVNKTHLGSVEMWREF